MTTINETQLATLRALMGAGGAKWWVTAADVAERFPNETTGTIRSRLLRLARRHGVALVLCADMAQLRFRLTAEGIGVLEGADYE